MQRPSVLAAPEAEDTSIIGAAEVLFGTDENPLPLRDGKKLVIKTGKVAHVGLLLQFFNALVQNMSREDIVTLVQLIEERKKKELEAQQQGLPLEEVTIEQLVEKAFNRSSLLVSVFNATVTTLPAIVSALTPLTREEWDDLDFDEGMLVAVTIFQVNYSFFSRNLPHAMRVFLALAAKKVVAR